MKTFFSRITADHWCAKNNLEKAAHKLATEMDRKILSESEVPAFKKEFQDKINALNLEFKRCKPLNFSIQASYDRKGDISIYCSGVFQMSLFMAKGEAIVTMTAAAPIYANAIEPVIAVPSDDSAPGNAVIVNMPISACNPNNNYFLYAGSPPTCLRSQECHGVFNEQCPVNVTCPIHKIYKLSTNVNALKISSNPK